MVVTPEGVRFSDRITLPYEPFTGTMGVSPEIEAVSSLQPDYWGGNMDLPDVAPGAVMYFPVQRPEAWFYVGDCHARQGDGELCGVAVEIPATVTLRLDLVKGWSIPGVRLETEDFIMSVGSARPMEDAARMAYRDLVRWLVRRLRLRGGGSPFPLHPGRAGAPRQHGRPRNTRSGPRC